MQHLIQMLATSEYAWGRHLLEFANQLDSPLKEQILSQAQDEIKHGRILAGTMASLNLYPRIARENQPNKEVYLFNNPDKLTGFYAPVIGGSNRLKTLRFVLQGKRLEDYSIPERLAFAQVVELMGHNFYQLLAVLAPHPLKGAAVAIALDEAQHKSYLFDELRSLVGTPVACLLIAKWLGRFIIISPVALKEFLWG